MWFARRGNNFKLKRFFTISNQASQLNEKLLLLVLLLLNLLLVQHREVLRFLPLYFCLKILSAVHNIYRIKI